MTSVNKPQIAGTIRENLAKQIFLNEGFDVSHSIGGNSKATDITIFVLKKQINIEVKPKSKEFEWFQISSKKLKDLSITDLPVFDFVDLKPVDGSKEILYLPTKDYRGILGSKQTIQSKIDHFICFEKDRSLMFYSFENNRLPQFCDNITDCFFRLRLKNHGKNKHSLMGSFRVKVDYRNAMSLEDFIEYSTRNEN